MHKWEGHGYRAVKKYSHHPDLSLFLRSVILANNASGEETGEKEDPLEQALLHMAEEAGKRSRTSSQAVASYFGDPF